MLVSRSQTLPLRHNCQSPELGMLRTAQWVDIQMINLVNCLSIYHLAQVGNVGVSRSCSYVICICCTGTYCLLCTQSLGVYCNLLPYSVAKLFIIRVVLLTLDRQLQTTPTTFIIILNFCIITIILLRLLFLQFIGRHTQL